VSTPVGRPDGEESSIGGLSAGNSNPSDTRRNDVTTDSDGSSTQEIPRVQSTGESRRGTGPQLGSDISESRSRPQPDGDRAGHIVETVGSPGDRSHIPPVVVTQQADTTREHRTVPDQGLGVEPSGAGAFAGADRTPALDPEAVMAREKSRFGGMKLGSAFFGWLTATGLAVLLIAVLAAAGVAFGVTGATNVDQAVQASQNGTGTAKTVGLIGAIVLAVIILIAYYCGGYVAGRMARFDGVKQGFAVWLWAIFTSAIIAAVAAIAGSKYNVLSQLNLPRIPVDEGAVTTVGIIAIVAAVVIALVGALIGGQVGTRFHRRVDAVGFGSGDRAIEGSPATSRDIRF